MSGDTTTAGGGAAAGTEGRIAEIDMLPIALEAMETASIAMAQIIDAAQHCDCHAFGIAKAWGDQYHGGHEIAERAIAALRAESEARRKAEGEVARLREAMRQTLLLVKARLPKCFHCGGEVRPSEDHTVCGRIVHADIAVCEVYKRATRPAAESPAPGAAKEAE
jgi:hypothetical protein